MKLVYRYIIYVVLLGLFFQACSNMNDLQDIYMKDGEIIYAAKVDSVIPRAGNNRILFDIYIASQRVETVRIFWNNYSDSTEISIGGQTGHFEKILANLEENKYLFQFVNIDKFGNKSLPTEVSAGVYGARFQENLTNRSISSITSCYNGKMTINWSGLTDNLFRCDLTYRNTKGELITRKVSMDETSTTLNDLGKDLRYRTIFLPEETAIDTFYVDWTIKKFTAINDYYSEGELVHPTNGARNIGRYKQLTKNEDESIDLELGDLFKYNFFIKLKIKEDNSILITPIGDTPNIDQTSYGTNFYDPNTKKFHLNYAYYYEGSAPRVIHEVISPVSEERISKSKWKIVGFSSQNEVGESYPNGFAKCAIDGDVNTFWVSQWNGFQAQYPHWFTIDLGEEILVSSFEVVRRQFPGGQSKQQFLTSLNGTDWTDGGTFPMDEEINSGQRFKCTTSPQKARYIKYVALEGPNFYGFLAEFYAYTPKE